MSFSAQHSVCTSIRLINNNWTVPCAGAFTQELSDLSSLVGLENRGGHVGLRHHAQQPMMKLWCAVGTSERHSATQELSPTVCRT